MKRWVILLSLGFGLFSQVALALNFCAGMLSVQVQIPADQMGKKIKPGTPAYLMHQTLGRERPVQFIGELKNFGSQIGSYLFIDPTDNTFHVVPKNKVEVYAVGSDNQNRQADPTLFVESGSQGQSPTCAAATLFNCIRQTGLKENASPEIRKRFTAEGQSGMRLYQLFIDRIYNSGNVDYGSVIQRSAAEFEVKTFEHPRANIEQFAQSIYRDVQNGWPVIIRFDIKAGMQPAPFEFLDHRNDRETPEVLQSRIWIPDNTRNNNVGHAVTLMSLFWVNGESYFLVSDPNFRNPRVWPTSYLGRMETARMQAWTLWHDRKPPPPNPFDGAVGMLWH